MSESVLFLNMFSQYQPPEGVKEILSQAAVAAADIDPETRKVSVAIHAPKYISQSLLDQQAKVIAQLYGLSRVDLLAVCPADQLTAVEPEELMAMFVKENSMCRGSLAGAQWQWEGNTLHINLRANGKEVLLECVRAVKETLQQKFSTDVNIEIHAGEILEGKALFDAMEKMRTSMIGELPKASAPTAKKEEKPQESNAIYGKPFKGTA